MPLSHETLLMLKRWNTPTIYNGWEQNAKSDLAKDGFNMEPTKDYMQEMGPMVGYAVTTKIQPSKQDLVPDKPHAWSEYREYVASVEIFLSLHNLRACLLCYLAASCICFCVCFFNCCHV